MNSTRSIMEGCMCGGYIIIKHKLLGWISNPAREILSLGTRASISKLLKGTCVCHKEFPRGTRDANPSSMRKEKSHDGGSILCDPSALRKKIHVTEHKGDKFV